MNAISKKVVLILVSLIFCIPSVIHADGNGGNNNESQTRPVIIIGGNRPMRPKTPLMQEIYGFYENGYLFLEFAIPEGQCVMTINELIDGTSRQYYFESSEDVQVYIGAITEVDIRIETANGNIYDGYIE